MMKKNLFLFLGLFSLSLSVSVCLTNFSNKNAMKVLADSTDEFLSGSGTEDDPYLISTKYHLNNVRNHSNSCFKLVTNINFLDTDFESGGSFYNSGKGFSTISNFTGTFDGNNFKINNIHQNTYCGLFEKTNGATFKNLTLDNMNVSSNNGTTGILTRTASSTIFSNVVVKGTATFNRNYTRPTSNWSSTSPVYSGGICGSSDTCSFDNCINYTTIVAGSNTSYTGNNIVVGGIVGNAINTSLNHCFNYGNITSFSTCGGIVGFATQSGTDSYLNVRNCKNYGTLTQKDQTDKFNKYNNAPHSYCSAGGIVGYCSHFKCVIDNCVNEGNLITSMNAGGIIAVSVVSSSTDYSDKIDVSISNCKNLGNLSSFSKLTDTDNVWLKFGGICAYFNGNQNKKIRINNVCNYGNLDARSGRSDSNTSHHSRVGGIAGHGYYIDVNNAFNCGTIQADHNSGSMNSIYLGGFAGQFYGSVANFYNAGIIGNSSMEGYDSVCSIISENVTFPGSYALAGTAPLVYPGNSTFYSEEQMSTQATFSEFDFESFWYIDSSSSYKYPQLVAFRCDSDISSVRFVRDDYSISTTEKVYPSFESIVFAVTYENGENYQYKFNSYYACSFDYVTIGTTNVYCSFLGILSENSISLTVVQKTISYIDMNTLPTKLEYTHGVSADIDTDGGYINVHYNNGDIDVVALSTCDITGFDSSIKGYGDLTVTYCGFVTSYTIHYVYVTSISVSKKPTKLTYVQYQPTDFSTGKIQINYSNETSEIVTIENEWCSFDRESVGTTPVTISYLDVTATFNITINARTIKTYEIFAPTKTTYNIGEELDLTGGYIHIIFNSSDNYSEDFPLTQDMVSGFDSSTSGIKYVNVKFGEIDDIFVVNVLDTYTVTFVDYDGTVISSGTYHYGDTISVPSNPTRPSDNTYNYIFTGWDKDVSSTCTGNATYTATFSNTYIEYTVTFVDYDGTVISSGTYHYGDTISVPSNPTRPSDNTYNYIFTGWDKDVSSTCTGNATYTAQYSSEYIEYTVTFLDENGNVISTGTYHYGDSVTVPTPTKDSDNTYNYTFTGWDKDVSETCTGNATYTASFSSSYIEYTVTFVDYDGTVISSGTYHYGDTISVPSNPTRQSDNTYDYTFTGWDKDVSSTCTGNVTYTAQYSSEYTEEYKSGLLRDQLISEIDSVTNVDLSTYSTIVGIQSRMDDLTAADRAIVEQKLNILIEQYNNFVNGINNEFDTSERVFDGLFFGAVAAMTGIAYGLAFIIKRRFPL